MVGELRAKTDAPMMECKKALTEAAGDLAKAEEILRVKLGSKASKAASRVAAEGVDYIIPGNDDSSRAIRLYARGVADAVLEGRALALHDIVAGGSDEFVEVEEEGADDQA
jgi:hypothetical protein